jgi:hypothetical protein
VECTTFAMQIATIHCCRYCLASPESRTHESQFEISDQSPVSRFRRESVVSGAKTRSGRRDVLVNYTTETIGTLTRTSPHSLAGKDGGRVGQGGVRAGVR